MTDAQVSTVVIKKVCHAPICHLFPTYIHLKKKTFCKTWSSKIQTAPCLRNFSHVIHRSGLEKRQWWRPWRQEEEVDVNLHRDRCRTFKSLSAWKHMRQGSWPEAAWWWVVFPLFHFFSPLFKPPSPLPSPTALLLFQLVRSQIPKICGANHCHLRPYPSQSVCVMLNHDLVTSYPYLSSQLGEGKESSATQCPWRWHFATGSKKKKILHQHLIAVPE